MKTRRQSLGPASLVHYHCPFRNYHQCWYQLSSWSYRNKMFNLKGHLWGCKRHDAHSWWWLCIKTLSKTCQDMQQCAKKGREEKTLQTKLVSQCQGRILKPDVLTPKCAQRVTILRHTACGIFTFNDNAGEHLNKFLWRMMSASMQTAWCKVGQYR